MSNINLLAFGVYPYIALAICIIGSWAESWAILWSKRKLFFSSEIRIARPGQAGARTMLTKLYSARR